MICAASENRLQSKLGSLTEVRLWRRQRQMGNKTKKKTQVADYVWDATTKSPLH